MSVRARSEESGPKRPARRRFQVLKRRSDFVATFRSGRRVRPAEWLYFNYEESDVFRCGWTVPRAVGVAVVRNRLKRWCREWIREKVAQGGNETISVHLNIGFRSMPEGFYKKLEYAEFCRAMEAGWKKLMRAQSAAK